MAPHMTPRPLPEPVDIARARRAQLLAAINALECALAVPARDPTWTTQVASGVDRLAQAFDAHVVATEGPEGMYADVLRNAPRLSFAVNQLVVEHADGRASIAALGKLVDDLSGAAPDYPADLIERIREDGTQLLASLVRHRQRGADLVFEAYQHDIGGCD
ncbi:MAG TPA: hypothetical protein VFR23_23035 [Jiangellaceae bacterium]|nr:hypothetical protein [Jiangellaceae bacterium]